MNDSNFLQLIENCPFGMYVVDADMTLRHVSEGSQKVFARFDPVIGHDFAAIMRTLWPQPFAEEILEHFRHTLKTGERYRAPTFVQQRNDTCESESYEWQLNRITMPDGRYGVVCYYYDATDRQRESERMLERENHFRQMADAAPAMVWVTNADHFCTFLSRGWVDHTGQTLAEGLGTGWLSMISVTSPSILSKRPAVRSKSRRTDKKRSNLSSPKRIPEST